MLNTKGMRFSIDVILVCIRWYAVYPLSYRHLEEMMKERGVRVDRSSINRWAIGFLPQLENAFRKHKQPMGSMRFFKKAMQANSMPENVTMDKGGANKSAIDPIIADKDIDVHIRQFQYLNSCACRNRVDAHDR